MAENTTTPADDISPEVTWTVRVGHTTSRPVRPDEHTSTVTVLAATESEALRTAMSMVCARTSPPQWDRNGKRLGEAYDAWTTQMPTRTTVVAVVL